MGCWQKTCHTSFLFHVCSLFHSSFCESTDFSAIHCLRDLFPKAPKTVQKDFFQKSLCTNFNIRLQSLTFRFFGKGTTLRLVFTSLRVVQKSPRLFSKKSYVFFTLSNEKTARKAVLQGVSCFANANIQSPGAKCKCQLTFVYIRTETPVLPFDAKRETVKGRFSHFKYGPDIGKPEAVSVCLPQNVIDSFR